MFKFFDFIVTLIGSIVNFVISTIEMLVQVIIYITKGIAYLILGIAYLPPFAKVPLIAIISYIAIITLLNKGE